MIITADEHFWNEVADYVQGSCHSDAEISAAFQMTPDIEDLIGEKMFERDYVVCDQCGWWIEVGEMSDNPEFEQTCTDCEDDQHG